MQSWLVSVSKNGELLLADIFATSLVYLPTIFRICRWIDEYSNPDEHEILIISNVHGIKRESSSNTLGGKEIKEFAEAARYAGLSIS